MKRLVPIIVIVALVVGGGLLAYVRSHSERGIEGPVLSARFLDADYGAAAILRTPEGKIVVIDPASRGAKALADLLKDEPARNVTVILTDPTPDCALALAALQKSVGVSRLIGPGTTDDWNAAFAKAKCDPVARKSRSWAATGSGCRKTSL